MNLKLCLLIKLFCMIQRSCLNMLSALLKSRQKWSSRLQSYELSDPQAIKEPLVTL